MDNKLKPKTQTTKPTTQSVYATPSISTQYKNYLSEADRHQITLVISTILDEVKGQLKGERTAFTAGDICKWYYTFKARHPELYSPKTNPDHDLYTALTKYEHIFDNAITMGRLLAQSAESLLITKLVKSGNRTIWSM